MRLSCCKIRGHSSVTLCSEGLGCVRFPGGKHYEGVRFNLISVSRGWVGVKYPGGKALCNT